MRCGCNLVWPGGQNVTDLQTLLRGKSEVGKALVKWPGFLHTPGPSSPSTLPLDPELYLGEPFWAKLRFIKGLHLHYDFCHQVHPLWMFGLVLWSRFLEEEIKVLEVRWPVWGYLVNEGPGLRLSNTPSSSSFCILRKLKTSCSGQKEVWEVSGMASDFRELIVINEVGLSWLIVTCWAIQIVWFLP